MTGVRWIMTPLAGTAGVLLGLCLVAIPLRKLTSAPPMQTAVKEKISNTEIPAVFRLRLLAPAKRIVIKTADHKILLDLRDIAPGESEYDATIPFSNATLDLTLHAEFGDSSAETAAFLTLMPDGHEEQTRYSIGTGLIDDTLNFEWHTH
jgi:hypothetical protein